MGRGDPRTRTCPGLNRQRKHTRPGLVQARHDDWKGRQLRNKPRSGRIAGKARNDRQVKLRDYTDADTAATLTVFLHAIRETAAADYAPAQTAAWAAEPADGAHASGDHRSACGRICRLDDNGHVVMLVVDPDLAPQRSRGHDVRCNCRPRPT